MSGTIVQKMQNGEVDVSTVSSFVNDDAQTIVPRRLSTDVRTLEYYLEFLRGLELVYSQQTGTVSVNGIERKTISQAVSDALASQAYKGDTGDAAIISAITANTLSPGTSATATMGGTPGDRTIALGIPRGDKGATGTISAVTVKTGTAGSDASVVLSGVPEDRSIELTVPRGDKGEQGDPVPITTTLGQSDTQAVSQKLLTDVLGDLDSALTAINGV